MATKPDSIVLDSFAGSGTTAHAVLQMNKNDGGKRKFISVEMMDYAETITAERIRRVIAGYSKGKRKVEGTGGDFSYYELGEPLMLDADHLNEKVEKDKIREYVWYTETKQPLADEKNLHEYLMGTLNGTAYYFYYNPEQLTILNYSFLSSINEKAENYVIYADRCALNDAELMQFGITFKKIPRDIAKL